MKNVVIRAKQKCYDVRHKEDIEIKVKTTDKKHANGLIIPFEKEIILDEDGKDYVFSIASVDFSDDFTTVSHFIVRLNDEHANMLNIDRISKKQRDSYYDGLKELLDSLSVTDKINKLIADDCANASYNSLEELRDYHLDLVLVYLTKVKYLSMQTV